MINYLRTNFGRDAGHSLMGVLLALSLHAFGLEPAWACGLLGGIAYAIPKELYDLWRGNWRLRFDHFSDLASYQVSWPAAYAAARLTAPAVYSLGAVLLVYLIFVSLKLRGEKI
jgi:hypothetical protein